jgi:hypothetical protein
MRKTWLAAPWFWAALALTACGEKFSGSYIYHGTVHWGAFVFHEDGRLQYIYENTRDDFSVGVDTVSGTFTVEGDTATFHVDRDDPEDAPGFSELNGLKAVVNGNMLEIMDYPLCPCPRGSIPL